jgi:hypothetical protein
VPDPCCMREDEVFFGSQIQTHFNKQRFASKVNIPTANILESSLFTHFLTVMFSYLAIALIWLVAHSLFKLTLAVYKHVRSVWVLKRSGAIERGDSSWLMGVGAALENNSLRMQDFRLVG